MKQQSSKAPSVGDEAYVYDKNGNMVEDKYKKIQISYNYLNLPLQIEYKSGENNFIHFVYSATGEKLQKIVTVEGKVQSKTDYINGIEYKNDVLQRIAHTEGSLSRQDDDKFLQEYVLRDHLGNTRVTFTDVDNDANINEKDIKQINHYYCFGLNMEGNWNGAAGSNKYQYNGKEWNDDFGLGWNDYGARFYDPAIAKWVVIDALADKYVRWSPYNYCKDNPIKFVDPDGKVVELYDSKNRLVATIGKDGIKYEKIKGGGDIVKAYTDAKAYFKGTSGSKAFEALENDTRVLKINESKGKKIGGYTDPDAVMKDGKKEYVNKSELGSIGWNPNLGGTDAEGNRHSPAMILLHEIFHGKHFKEDAEKHDKDTITPNEKFENNEEEKATEETNQVSKELDEADKNDPKTNDGGNGTTKKRTSHKEGKPFKAKSTTSNQEQE